jgi:DNA-directed RNA polymerase subunit alpha
MTEKPWVKFVRQSDTWGRFVVEPLERGYGATLGNAIRRVLLSSLEGASVTSVRFEGVAHEFSTITGVQEDVLEIILNIKELVIRSYTAEPKIIKISARDKGPVTGGDIEHDAEIEVVNPDHVLANISEKAKLDLEMVVETGVGYKPAELNKKADQPIGSIPVDSSFSPIKRVNFTVDEIRVGEQIGFDRLVLDVWTNGAIGPDEAVKKSVSILMEHFQLFLELNKKASARDAGKKGGEDDDAKKQVLEMTIEDLELSARSYNCLKKSGIAKVSEILSYSEKELMNIKNFGRKSAEEILEKLAQFNLFLRKDGDDSGSDEEGEAEKE